MNAALTRKLSNFAAQRWDGWLQILVISILVLMTLNHGRFSVDEKRMISLGMIAILSGLMLVETRWSGKWAAGYSLVSSLVFTFLFFSGILTELMNSQGFLQWMGSSSLRGSLFLQRMAGWCNALSIGVSLDDPLPGIWAGSIILWNALIWMIWWIQIHHEGLIALMPCGVIQAWNNLQQGQKASAFVVFLFLALMIIAFTAYRRRIAAWESQGVDWPYPGSFLPEWTASAGIFAVIICAIAYLFVTLATPEGWWELREKFEEIRQSDSAITADQSESEQVAGQDYGTSSMLNDLEPPALYEIGIPPSPSRAALFWVSVSSPASTGTFSHDYRWRMQIYDTYDGRGWSELVDMGDQQTSGVDVDHPMPGRSLLVQDVRISVNVKGMLPAVNQPVLAENAELVRYSPDSILVKGTVNAFTVHSWVATPADMFLSDAQGEIPSEISGRYLQLPDSLPLRVVELAQKVAGDAATNFEKATLLQDFLRKNYRYSLTAPIAPDGSDAVGYFLFDSREGFCSHYASAMVILLRSLDIPARIVSGYSEGEFDTVVDAYRVMPSNAHTWVEVYFPVYGWVEFEPTPVYPVPVYGTKRARLPVDFSPLAGIMETLVEIFRWSLALLLIVAVFLFGFRFFDRRRTKHKPVDPFEALYWNLNKSIRSTGFTNKPSNTPKESLAAYLNYFKENTLMHQAIQVITRIHEKAIYSPSKPSREEYRQAVNFWSRIKPSLNWLALRHSINHFFRNPSLRK